MKKQRNHISSSSLFLCRAVAVGTVYFALLLPTQLHLQLLPGTEVRIAAFVPIVGGILWGAPAAVGAGLGNLLSDLVLYSSSPFSILAGSLLNGLAAMLARRLFYALPGTSTGSCVYDLTSLIRYIAACFLTQISLCSGISMVLRFFSGLRVWETFPMMLANNMAACILLGLPAIIFVPRFFAPDTPKTSRRELPRYFLSAAIPIPLLCLCFLDRFSDIGLGTVISLNILLIALFDVFGPWSASEGEPVSFRSMKAQCFRWISLCSVGISVLVTLLLGFVLSAYTEDILVFWRSLYRLLSVLIISLTVCFSLVTNLIEKRITSPLSELTSHIRTDEQSMLNEMEVLSARLDFVAGDREALRGNEYTLYVGLTSRDGERHFDPETARKLIGDICLSYVTGYISAADASGGYRSGETAVREDVLVYTIFGANDEEICSIADDVLRILDQESILIDKNRLTKWYYRGT